MAVKGKYHSIYEPGKLWIVLFSTDAICYAVPEIDQLKEVTTDSASGDLLAWHGTGSLSGVGTAAATIIATILQPLIEYTLRIECKIGSVEVKATAHIQLTADEHSGTIVNWDASIVNADTGRTETMFEWTAGLVAQHFFKRIDHYISTFSPDQGGHQDHRSYPGKSSHVLPDITG
jgi:predicted metal-dependent hydrolase